MKKSLRKPENWQDFESLCKKLFGEIWECSLTIKKNGRAGQAQSGVDIYGRPKGSEMYWGVQCKGKDDYTKAQLTEKEIDSEIEKAHNFKPALETFFFATTANKDVEIEEYIRLKDQESRASGSFEIVLFSWEDLADLIEENCDTFTWYINDQKYKDKFGFDVVFEGGTNEKTITPVYIKKIKRYEIVKPPTDTFELMRFNLNRQLKKGLDTESIYPKSPFRPSHKNYCWCPVKLTMRNLGNKALDDWKVYFYFQKENCKSLEDDSPRGLYNFNIDPKYSTSFAHDENKSISYYPFENRPLLQTESISTTAYILPAPNIKSINVDWVLVARDYKTEGSLMILVEALIEEKLIIDQVTDEQLLLPDEISIEEKRELIRYPIAKR